MLDELEIAVNASAEICLLKNDSEGKESMTVTSRVAGQAQNWSMYDYPNVTTADTPYALPPKVYYGSQSQLLCFIIR